MTLTNRLIHTVSETNGIEPSFASRHRSKIGLCGLKTVHDHGDGISYFVTQESTDYGSYLFLVDT